MAIGWEDTLLQRRLLKKAMFILCIVILPLAISVHTVSAWLIAMTLRPGWDTSLMGPYFVFGALVAGCAILIIIIALLRHGYKLEHYLTSTHFSKLAALLLALTAFYLYLNLNKYGVPAFKMEKAEGGLLKDLFFGKYAFLFWFTMIAGLVIPIVLLSFKKIRQSIRGVVVVAVMVLLGSLINRYLIVTPNMLHPFIAIQHAQLGYATYNPTMIEWAITASSLAGFVLLIILLFKLFPVITMWEVIEGVEKSGEKEVGVEDLSNIQIIQGHAS